MKNIILILFSIFLIDCSNKKSYSVKGTIIEVRQEENEFLIHHDEIPNFMMAMTMPFKLSDSLDAFQYKEGDSVSFKLVFNNIHLKITAFVFAMIVYYVVNLR